MRNLLRDARDAASLLTYHYAHVISLVVAAYRTGGGVEG